MGVLRVVWWKGHFGHALVDQARLFSFSLSLAPEPDDTPRDNNNDTLTAVLDSLS